jgi:hypothetical protein
VAAETDFKLQFWLSQFTEMPLVLLSGMPVPDAAGLAAHKVRESQVVLTGPGGLPGASLAGDPPPPPPPQAVRKQVTAKRGISQKGDRMQNSERNGVCIGFGSQYPQTLSTQDQTRDLNGLK